jgi:16S rRNA (cytosine967-C5)-methyltransferase
MIMTLHAKISDKLLSRTIALEIIYLTHKGNSLKQAFNHNQFVTLNADAKPFTRFLVTQTIRYHHIFLHIIQKYLSKKPQNKSLEFVYSMLSLGACELLLSEQKPNITLNSYTEITKLDKKTNHLSGIIRAILGKIHKDSDILKPLFKDYKLVFGHDLYQQIMTDYPKDYEKICEWLLVEPFVDCLKLTDCPTPEGYTELSPISMRYKQGVRPENLKIFTDGEITIQSYASHLALAGAGTIAEKNLLDLCAAPGGKTLQAIAHKATVTAVDISEKRLEKLHDNLRRTGLKANIIVTDVLDYKPNNLFDIVLLDAPCSATGTIRKNPDIIHHFNLDNHYALQALQQKMLNHACHFVKPDGLLIYAVCSLSKQEGEQQILEFLKHHDDFCVMIPQNSNSLPVDALDNEGFIRLLPYHDKDKGGHDGFFIAYLKRLKNLKE